MTVCKGSRLSSPALGSMPFCPSRAHGDFPAHDHWRLERLILPHHRLLARIGTTSEAEEWTISEGTEVAPSGESDVSHYQV